MARAFIAAFLLAVLAASPAAQGGGSGGDLKALRSRLEQRFQILPLANGVVLTPRFKAAVRSIEVTDEAIAIDGTSVTGAELRQKLGADADLVLQLSYLDSATRRVLAGVQAAPSLPAADSTASTPQPPAAASETSADRPERPKRRDDVVRVGGSVTVARDEHVTGDVVAIGGSVNIDGQVDGDVVAVGGSANLGPTADIRGDLVVVGGALNQDPKATIGGQVHIGFDDFPLGGDWGHRRSWRGWSPFAGMRPIAQFMGTIVRVGLLMLFAGLVLFVAKTPVEQVAERAAAEPVKSWAVGLLAEVLFVPVFTLTAFILAVSIIGIPVLLLLIPVAIVGAIVIFLVGFTGVAYHLGRLLQARVDYLRARPYAATVAGIVLIVSPLLLGRLVGLTGEMRFVVGILVAIGVVIEYIAWTTGLGAVALARFGKPTRPPVEMMPPVSEPKVI